jgi:predicted DCC family thiol-disulfide oxidoreductase YuxK
MNDLSHPVILFDGICNLCNRSVQLVIKHDKKRLFRFASLQSSFGESVLKRYNLPADTFNSFILLVNNKIYTRSTAALLVAKRLSGLIKLLYGFIIVPKFIRDFVYDVIAKNRYKWFGKKEACWIPTPELKELFLDTDNLVQS